MNGTERIWLGELSTTGHYDSLVSWAKSIAEDGKITTLPDALKLHQFMPKAN
jgi:hypothetical protein